MRINEPQHLRRCSTLDHRTLPDADSKILERALYLKELSGRQVIVATCDTTMGFMAHAHGLDVASSNKMTGATTSVQAKLG